jgi:hypothetical protein
MRHIRSFNIAGACKPSEHYMLPAVPRLPEVNDLIDEKYYFVIHAPRQSGKTTCLKILTDTINSDGKYYAFCCSLASLSTTVDYKTAMGEIVDEINVGLISSKVDEIRKLAFTFDSRHYMTRPVIKIRLMLNELCQTLDRELVIFFDEADCLHEEPLIKFLSQIRNGYIDRSDSPGTRFPRSLALAGMRDIRDYLTKIRPQEMSKGPVSPFNVKAKSLTLSDFTLEEINTLYSQHTAETGQVFQPEAVYRAWYWTEGQPWLVCALAQNVIVQQFKNDYSKTVTEDDIDRATQDLILSNPTHFDSLIERLRETRVRKVMDSVVIGSSFFPDEVSDDDVKYVTDLGLLKPGSHARESLRPSNPIYGELILRALTSNLQKKIPDVLTSKWMDGTSLDMDSLLKAFQIYWRENSEAKTKTRTKATELDNLLNDTVAKALQNHVITDKYMLHEMIVNNIKDQLIDVSSETYAHLVLFAFLQRVLNGGADFIQREYALGMTKSDICISYKDVRYPLEIKIKGVMSREESLDQLLGYMDKCGSSAGWLIVFDRDVMKSWEEKLFWETMDRNGKTIRVVGC